MSDKNKELAVRHEDDDAEVAYWRFDARVKGYSEWKGRPQSERDAFKAEYRQAESRYTARIAELEAEVERLKADKSRIDWLADPENNIAQVLLPREIVERNLGSLRDAIDEAMEGGAPCQPST